MVKIVFACLTLLAVTIADADVTANLDNTQNNPIQVRDFYGNPQVGHTGDYYQQQIVKNNQAAADALTVHSPPQVFKKLPPLQPAKPAQPFANKLKQPEQTNQTPANNNEAAVDAAPLPDSTEMPAPPPAPAAPATPPAVANQQDNGNNVTSFGNSSSSNNSAGSGGFNIQY